MDSGLDKELEAKLDAFRGLQEIIERLRGPGGCPWDREQTLQKMSHNLLEEACEAIDAIQDGKGTATPAVLEELGDLLMNILLASRIAEESGAFSIREVADMISAKLIRRHPHVFGDEHGASVADVLKRWNAIKAEEKGKGEGSLLARIPRSLPSLSAAFKVGKVAGQVGFDWPDASSVFEKVEEEVREVEKALGRAGKSEQEMEGTPEEDLHHEIGDLLFAVVNLARKAEVNPEEALRAAVDRFSRRFRYIEERIDVTRASLDEMEVLWNQAKTDEH